MRAAVVGAGAVGARVARQLGATDRVDDLVVVTSSRPALVTAVGTRARLGTDPALPSEDTDVVVLANGRRDGELAEHHLRAGRHVVSVADRPSTVRHLLSLDALARSRSRACIVGAAFSPGLACLVARLLLEELDGADEIHVARSGTGGPACAREHHRALGATSVEIGRTGFDERPGGSGRELYWFPDPVGPRDCYRGDLAEPALLARAFPLVSRITARVAATRRDRVTARLPMLRHPHPEGIDGAVRVEVRGWAGLTRRTLVAGSASPPAVAAGAVAAAVAVAVSDGLAPPGAFGVAEMPDVRALLADVVERGVRIVRFEGHPV